MDDYDDYYDAAKKDGERFIQGKNGGCIDRGYRKAKHTPGPWASHWPNNTGLKAGVWTANGEINIARCDSSSLSIEGNRANARLIAAAPELLAELQKLLAAYRALAKLGYSQDDAYTVGPHNAIAKATGAA